MEDDDGEGSYTESQVLTDSELLKIHRNSTTDTSDFSDDEKEEEKEMNEREEEAIDDEEDEDEEEEEIYPENFPTRLPNPVSHPVFKGFKKRIPAPKVQFEEPVDNSDDDKRCQNLRRGKMNEYAQYLGLQPAAKYNKCSKCSVVNSHRNQGRDECLCQSKVVSPCIPEPPPPPPPPPPPLALPPPPTSVSTPSDNHPSTSKITNNFRISRKVYLCAACGTYFENWNLFLHMREIHKRHICLFCLGMFGQAERLSHHLEKKHSVTETPFNSVEDFYNAFKGSCYLICCSCEKVFSETDNFYNHFCPTSPNDKKLPEEEEVCSVCRQVGLHTATCQRQSDVKHTSSKSGGKIRTKNNRVKRSEKHMLTSYQKKLSQLYARNMNLKTERKFLDNVPSEPTVSNDNCATPDVSQNVEKSTEHSSLSRDTVAETIMQVSTVSDNVGGDVSSKNPPIEIKTIDDKPEELITDVENRDQTTRDNWDSVTETIMRVSRFDEPLESGNLTRNCESDRLMENHDQEMSVDDSNQPDAPQDSEKRDESSSDAEEYEHNEEEEEESLKKLESPPMSVSRVNRTKGSLVIKICTNKNSHYSVSTPNMNGIDESEDNHNESDSDNERLTVALAEENKRVDSDEREPSASNFNEFVSEINQLETEDNRNMNNTGINEEPNQIIQENIQESSKLESNTDGRDIENNISEDNIPLADDDVPCIDVNVDGLLESLKIVDLLKGCIEAASSTCVYCNHARHIAVEGKQLALHMLAEHRFQPQHPAIIIQMEQFVSRVKKSIDELNGHYFNADSYDSDIGTYYVPDIRMYECFNCRVVSHIHKDLYLHNRKMHQKTILICVMCKSTFYSYSELLCHLCPGIYSATSTDMTNHSLTSAIVNPSIKYRCCICTIDPLPSAFRLMVHLRKRHHACDVCLELTGNQHRLSNHVWKHKLHHLCYRCGIAYRNKPDITKHLFWKHGTESVLCKKCLQKKWPHIYHFCIPPSAFVCEECNVSFSKAVALKVHKRLHAKEEPYSCVECNQRFISKKLLIRHEVDIHRPPPEPPELPARHIDNNYENNTDANGLDSLPDNSHKKSQTSENSENEITADPAVPSSSLLLQNQAPDKSPTSATSAPCELQPESHKATSEPVRKVVDVYDLPPLNLSSDSDSDDTDNDKIVETVKKEDVEEKSQQDDEIKIEKNCEKVVGTTGTTIPITNEPQQIDEQQEQQFDIMNGIWDNFKSYATTTETNLEELAKSEEKIIEAKKRELMGIITADHDYCVIYGDSKMEEEPEQADNSPKMKDVGEDGVNIITDSVNESDQQPAFETEVTINQVDEVSVPAVESDVEKKKEKSPKKKTTNSNSSSSDSSSDSDSSSCSCGTNCSCSSSSSDSSSSSSSSSDSDSSASESSPKKQSDTRKRERKRAKNSGQHKRTKENPIENDEDKCTNAVTELHSAEELINVLTIDEPNVSHVQEQSRLSTIPNPPPHPPSPPQPSLPPVEKRNIMRESDLDTDESETDEDFYDEHPQELANKLLAEKRNQLMLLASVAAPSESSTSSILKNGTVDNALDIQSQSSGKKKIKVKKRKKTSDSRRGARGARGARGTRGRRLKYPGATIATAAAGSHGSEPEPPVKLNIPKPKVSRQKRPKIRFSSMVPPVNRELQSGDYPASDTALTVNQQQQTSTGYSGASGAETHGNENTRSSKRKRIPKKFYGDSSDDEQHQQNQYPKWRRIENNSGGMGHQGAQQQGHQYVPTITIKQNFGPPLQSKWYNTDTQQANFVVYNNETAASTLGASVTDTEEAVETSSESSGSDAEQPVNPCQSSADERLIIERPVENNYTIPGPALLTGDNKKHVYCYCQSPYDEVSEMIACDGSHCKIEWFHFECVGIMVPPKGKWYCPDCRKEDPTLKNDDFID